MRYFIKFAYAGTNYHGWQRQPNGISVQEVMTEVMQKIFGSGLSLTGAGRTDAGVHAEVMYAHFDVGKEIEDTGKMAYKLNNMMPKDICVYDILPVLDFAHARFDAQARTYEYRLSGGKDPFNRDFYARIYGDFCIEKMNDACKVLFEYVDFESFSKVHTDVKTFNCKIYEAFWKRTGNMLVFTIKADRFLRNMVRAIVGTMLEVGKGKISIDDFRKIIESKNRSNAGGSVYAKGLFLTDIAYPEKIFKG